MEECTRRLIHVPIIHSPTDMGSMGAELAAACIERLDRRHWDDYVAVLATFWQSVRAGLDGLGLDWVSRGATLMGTEDPKLLLEERRNVQAALASRPTNGECGIVNAVVPPLLFQHSAFTIPHSTCRNRT